MWIKLLLIATSINIIAQMSKIIGWSRCGLANPLIIATLCRRKTAVSKTAPLPIFPALSRPEVDPAEYAVAQIDNGRVYRAGLAAEPELAVEPPAEFSLPRRTGQDALVPAFFS
jgi:hypothetical protein